jgi:hypothetical protein
MKGDAMPLITLFTAPKPFVNPHINIIQRNTLRNWLALGDSVEVVVIGDEPGIAEVCDGFDILHLPNVRCNELGTPLISSIFQLAREVNDSPFLVYSNADILFFPELVSAVRKLGEKKAQFLGVGQRWDLDIKEPLDFSGDWEDQLRGRVQQHGNLHKRTGSDYFIYPRSCFTKIPDFAVGRAGWDNWMIFHARWQGWPLVDFSSALTVIHQNHDYAHLPNGIKHFFQPETAANIKLAGGRRTIFTLGDHTHVFDAEVLSRKKLDWKSFWREVEVFPLVRLHSKVLGNLFFGLFHPVKAFNELKGWLYYKIKQITK